jgi:hypothetical protein
MQHLASPPFSSLCVLLGYALTIGSHNSKEGPRNLSDVTRNSTGAAFSAYHIPALTEETEGSAAQVIE